MLAEVSKQIFLSLEYLYGTVCICLPWLDPSQLLCCPASLTLSLPRNSLLVVTNELNIISFFILTNTQFHLKVVFTICQDPVCVSGRRGKVGNPCLISNQNTDGDDGVMTNLTEQIDGRHLTETN